MNRIMLYRAALVGSVATGFGTIALGLPILDPPIQQAYLKASNTDDDDRFGWSVAMSGDTGVVWAPHEDSNATGVDGDEADNSATGSGAAYVFVRDAGGNWTQQAYLKASNTDAGDQFGGPVSISGNTVVVGAQLEDSSATGVNGNEANNSANISGAAYVFFRDGGGTWSQQAYPQGIKHRGRRSIRYLGRCIGRHHRGRRKSGRQQRHGH